MADRVGQQLGNYRLIRLLGRGGFAEVYLGEHLRLGTHAAIKVLHTQLAQDDVEGFHKEARTIARLEHPHIVRVLDFDVEAGIAFLVMSYAPNGTLRQCHPKGTILPLVNVVSYVKQVADALQYAHNEKLIHRDIKPENMLLGRRNEILLTDFGIALVAQSSRYQNTQDMAGTMAYMAPEQIQGKPRPASDQYSLGIVVYEWLSGERPFHGSLTEMVGQHLSVPPPTLLEKVPIISFDVEQVVMTALAKDPKKRFASIQAFATALEQASQFDAPTFVKPSAPTIQPPRVTIPSKPLIEPPASPPLPATQAVVVSKPVGTTLYTYRGHSGRVITLAWSPNGKYIASGGHDKIVQLWNTTKESNVITYRGHSGVVRAVAWSPDGKRVASASDDQTVQVWDAATGNNFLNYRGHSGRWSWVRSVAWSADGKRIASEVANGTVEVWDAVSGNMFMIYQGHSAQVYTLVWSPDNEYLASGSDDKTVQVWNATTGTNICTYQGHSNWVNAVAWSPDGTRIASGSDDKTVQVWHITNGVKFLTYRGHSGIVGAVAWSPDGKYIASGSYDKTVHVWDAATGSKFFTYRGHSDDVPAVAWSPDGKRIASGSWDGTVKVWIAP